MPIKKYVTKEKAKLAEKQQQANYLKSEKGKLATKKYKAKLSTIAIKKELVKKLDNLDLGSRQQTIIGLKDFYIAYERF